MFSSTCCLIHLIGLCFTHALAISSAERPYRCVLDVHEGDCREQILRWFYNSKSGHCETFVYSGCGGNANNFNDTKNCLLECNGTKADTHSYSIAAKATDQLQGGNVKDNGDRDQSKKTTPAFKHEIRSKRIKNHTKRSANQRTPNDKGVKNDSKDANGIQEILSQLSRSVNLLERIVHDNVGKTPKKRRGKKQRRPQSPPPTASINTLVSKQSNAQEEREEESEQRSLKTIKKINHSEHSKANDGPEDDVPDSSLEEQNLLDVKIKSIISDPSFIFSYNNISGRDLSALKEVVFGMDTKALRLVTPPPQVEEDNVDEVEAGNDPGETTIVQVGETDERHQMAE